MGYIRGNKHIYEEWSQHYGAEGWSYADVSPIYMKFEKQTDPMILSKYKSYHGSEGPVYIQSPKLSKLESDWFQTLKKYGYKVVDDINNPDFGDKNVGMIQQTIHNGRRLSTSSAYLEPNRNRQNLHIITNSTATKILFEDNTHHKRATGVEFHKDGKTFKVEVSKEVIVSAGAIASPQLLMLSGIGVKSHLESLGIQVIEDLPVGDNFHDGIQTYFNVKSHPSQDLSDEKGIKNLLTVDNMYEFYKSGTGPLSVFNSHTASFNTKYNNRTEWPDAAFKSTMNIISDGQNLIQNLDIGIQILKPQCRGNLKHINAKLDFYFYFLLT
ncbi:MAG TPA: GMC family oxidoreductase N-terminal domain-containing protein, partial [Ignavibacteriaceae bacterium]